MDEIDFDEAVRYCRAVKKDLEDMLAAIRDRSFYDVGYEIGLFAAGGETFRSVLPEFDVLETHLKARDSHALEDLDWSTCELINHYDNLYERIMARGSHYNKDVEVVEKLAKWRKNASVLAQIVCQMDD